MIIRFRCGRCATPSSLEVLANTKYQASSPPHLLAFCPTLRDKLAELGTREALATPCPNMSQAAADAFLAWQRQHHR